jgi:hypothetical protein
MALQTPHAAEKTKKRAGSSPDGYQSTRTSKRQAWNTKPTAARGTGHQVI